MKKIVLVFVIFHHFFLFSEIKLGIDRIDEYLYLFSGKRVGLITNATGYNSKGMSTISVLKEKVNLVLLFSPEHGLNGSYREGEKVSNSKDDVTSLKIYSLYGKQKKPTKEMLDQIDILCFDIQDVGSRFYTYISTMAYAMTACAEQKKDFIVFDRPNPISGKIVEGFILKEEFKSFVGLYPIPQRHGMTVGELGLMFNKKFGINCNLNVIPLKNWDRSNYFDETNLMWLPTSPNIPTAETSLIYSGMCLFEGTNISVGRGTTMPFRYIGAPFFNANSLATRLNEEKIEGVQFFPAYFTPSISIHSGEKCEGVYIVVTDKNKFSSVRCALSMFKIFSSLYKDSFKINDAKLKRCGLNLLFGNSFLTEEKIDYKKLFNAMKEDEARFLEIRKPYLLY